MYYLDELTGLKFYYNSKLYSPVYTQPDVIIITDRLLKSVEEHTLSSVKLLDYGCGTGYLGLSIAKLNPGIDLYIYDPSEEAMRVASINAKRGGIPVTEGSLDDSYHIIVANLPTYDSEQMESETLNGPKFAYDGGEDGLAPYFELFVRAKDRCNSLIIECQRKRQPALKAMAQELGWQLFFETDYGFAFSLGTSSNSSSNAILTK